MAKQRSFNVDPWTDKAMGLILKATDHKSKANLLIPGVHLLLSRTVSLLEDAEKRGELCPPDGKFLESGRELLREYARRNPGAILATAGGEN